MSVLARQAEHCLINGDHPGGHLLIRASFKPLELAHLGRLARSRTVPARVSFRSRIVLMTAQGFSDARVALELRTTVKTVRRWRERYVEGGVKALGRDAPGRGRKPSISAELIARVVVAKLRSESRGESHSCRQLAEKFGVSAASISRILVQAKRQLTGHANSRT